MEELYWRAETLQALDWVRGEGLAVDISPDGLAGFLVADVPLVARHLERLASEGYLEEVRGPEKGSDPLPQRVGPLFRAGADARHYRLTERGVAEGGRSFHDEFADLIHRGHGECSDDCWCHDPAHAGEPCPNQAHDHHES